MKQQIYFSIRPEIAGGVQHSIKELKSDPPILKEVHYEFEDWSGDCLVSSINVFLITPSAVNALRQMKATGFDLRPVQISTSDVFDELNAMRAPRRRVTLPDFKWLYSTGSLEKGDDFIKSQGHALIVSKRVVEALTPLGLANAEIERWQK
jgi:hypothetical protein